MDLMQAMRQRHSVRQYTEDPLTQEQIEALNQEIDACNQEGNLHIQLVLDEPQAFSGKLAHYGKFSGVRNYLVMVGPKGGDLDERCGYYGERLVLEAQRMGLNTCWVYMTYTKIPSAFEVGVNEKLVIVIAIGKGKNAGTPHRSKPVEAVADMEEPVHSWMARGVEAARLAPTAMNQQKYRIINDGSRVRIKTGLGICVKIDKGIVKYHFELGAGKENFTWVD